MPMNVHDASRSTAAWSRKSAWQSVTATVGLAVAAASVAAANPALAQEVLKPVDKSVLKPTFLIAPPGSQAKAHSLAKFNSLSGPGTTIPYWSTVVTSPLDHQSYNVSMVGGSPFAPHPGNTNLTYVPIVVKIHIRGFTFDPTKPANCDAATPQRRFFNSPLFRPQGFMSNGVDVTTSVPGGTQLTSAFQRANFWGAVQGSAYNVTLVPSRLTPIIVDYVANPANTVFGIKPCGPNVLPLGTMDINEYDALVQNLAAQYATPNQIPVVLSYNVVETEGGGCCIIGYHNAVPVPGGAQVYAVGTYVDPNIFSGGIADIYPWSHELAEMFDDPFVQSIAGVPGDFNNDLTPPWGHTGQVSGCQNNLEVGDPLTGVVTASVVGDGGFTYHYQDETFLNWFYRTPSTATGGKGSFLGTFPGGGQGVC